MFGLSFAAGMHFVAWWSGSFPTRHPTINSAKLDFGQMMSFVELFGPDGKLRCISHDPPSSLLWELSAGRPAAVLAGSRECAARAARARRDVVHHRPPSLRAVVQADTARVRSH